MTAALFGYKRLLCLVSFVISVKCTIDAATTPSGIPTPMAAYSDGSHCIGLWKRHNQSCYLFTAGKYSFAAANESCSDQKAHLVSISDDRENEFIRRERIQNTTAKAWIGLYKQTPNCNNITLCDWVWLDGSQLGYYNWTSGALPTISNCTVIDVNGNWTNGQSCTAELDFICKRGVWYPTTTSETTTMIMTTDISDPSSTNSTFDEVPSPEANKKEEGMAIIIGCVMGGLVLVAIVTVVVVVFLKRHRTSSQADQPVEDKDEETPPVAKRVRYNPGYEDVDLVETQGETNVTFKPAPDNTDTGAHGIGDNPHQLYSEPMKKSNRPGSKGILVNENTLYGSGK